MIFLFFGHFYRITVKNKSFSVSVPAGKAIAIHTGAKL